MNDRLTIVEPKIITTSTAPKLDDAKMRSSIGLNSTGASGSPQNSEIHLNQSFSGSIKLSPRARRSTRYLTAAQKQALEDRVNQDSKGDTMKVQEQRADDYVPMDDAGMQLFENTLELNFMQKLQLRIAQQRGINVDTLHGAEFNILKDYKKLEERKELLNNFHDFFAH